MRQVFMLMFLAATLVACGSSDNNEISAEDSNNTAQSDSKPEAAKSVSQGPRPSAACEAVDTDVVAKIMGWDASKTVTDELMNRKDGELTVCHYLEEGGAVQIMVRINHENKNAQAKKRLENGYKKLLTEGSKNISYTKIPTILGTETIMGMGEGKYNYRSYVLNSRYGNELDVNIEVYTDQGDEATLKSQLKSIMQAMQ